MHFISCLLWNSSIESKLKRCAYLLISLLMIASYIVSILRIWFEASRRRCHSLGWSSIYNTCNQYLGERCQMHAYVYMYLSIIIENNCMSAVEITKTRVRVWEREGETHQYAYTRFLWFSSTSSNLSEKMSDAQLINQIIDVVLACHNCQNEKRRQSTKNEKFDWE